MVGGIPIKNAIFIDDTGPNKILLYYRYGPRSSRQLGGPLLRDAHRKLLLETPILSGIGNLEDPGLLDLRVFKNNVEISRLLSRQFCPDWIPTFSKLSRRQNQPFEQPMPGSVPILIHKKAIDKYRKAIQNHEWQGSNTQLHSMVHDMLCLYPASIQAEKTLE